MLTSPLLQPREAEVSVSSMGRSASYHVQEVDSLAGLEH